jgi:hypothetical protein
LFLREPGEDWDVPEGFEGAIKWQQKKTVVPHVDSVGKCFLRTPQIAAPAS